MTSASTPGTSTQAAATPAPASTTAATSEPAPTSAADPAARQGATTATPSRPRLAASTVEVASLDQATIDAAFALMEANYELTNRALFESDLAEKQRIILLREPGTGQLKGFSTMHHQLVQTPRGTAWVVFSGDTTVHRDYWGDKTLSREFSRQLLLMKLRNPRRLVLWFLITKGYKSYLLLAHSFPKATPRYDNPNPPAWLEQVLRDAATRRFADQYDPTTGLITYSQALYRVREGLAPLTDAERAHEHIAFFESRNPHHADGVELACMAELRIRDLLGVIARVTVRRLRATLRLRPRR